jgi:hypothetical protein
MGLDMFLRGYVSEPSPSERIKDFPDIAYWRKANAIHGWFVKNVMDEVDEGGWHEVTKGKITALRDVCKVVSEDWSKGPELLPTIDGFFFGHRLYDSSYRDDVLRTLYATQEILHNYSDHLRVFYRASW